MGYFDPIADQGFRTDDKGQILFYRVGLLGGKAYILPNAAKKEEIRRFMNLYYTVLMALVLITYIAVDLDHSVAWVPISFLWYWLGTHRILSGVPTLRFEEASKAWASSYDLASLWFLAVASILSVAGSVFIMFQFPHDWLVISICVLGIILFGNGVFGFGHMIKAKMKNEEAE